MPLPGLLVAHREQEDERLDEKPKEPGQDRIWVRTSSYISRVDPTRPGVDERHVGIVAGLLIQSRRVHDCILNLCLHAVEVPRFLQVYVVQVESRPFQTTRQNADDLWGFRTA